MKAVHIFLLALMTGCACVARDDARQVWLGASDSRPAAKAAADYVCTGTNDERRRYYPQYMQQLFDLDLKKLLICTDPAKRKWVDALGTECP